MSDSYDAIVIGGGPAGSTAAAVLAQKGRRVILLEKEKFKASHFTKKYSVQFVGTSGRASLPFYFFQHLDHEAAGTWQVLRSEFDNLLLNNAREKGAQVMEQITVRDLIR